MSNKNQLLWDREKSKFLPDQLDEFLIWAFKHKASDITIQSEEEIWCEIHGKMYRTTKRKISHSEVIDLLVKMFDSESVKGVIQQTRDVDFAYAINPDRETRYRFRVNAVGVASNNSKGVQITLRSISDLPPSVIELGVEKIIIDNLTHKQGMILVCGATGSGKTTLLASLIRYLCEMEDGNRKILTFEAPVEFLFDKIKRTSTSIAQTEIGIGKDLGDFVAAIRNMLRRKPSIVLLGEARDAETIGEAVTASMTGHLLLTTVHTNNFSETIRRMVNVFPPEERHSRSVDIISALRMVVCQRLVPSLDGKGRIALKEYIVFNDEIVEELINSGPEHLTMTCRKIMKKYGHSFFQDAQEKFEKGLIGKSVLVDFARNMNAQEKDALVESLLRKGYTAQDIDKINFNESDNLKVDKDDDKNKFFISKENIED